MRERYLAGILTAVVLAVPASLSAVTADQVLAMSKAGVSDAVILEMIARDRTLVTMAPDQVITLRQQGVSDAVIVALLKSGVPTEESLRENPPADPPTAPIVAFVGHGAEWPIGRSRSYESRYDTTPVVAVPVPVPYAVSRRGTRRAVPRIPERNLERTANPLMCLERISVAGSAFAPPFTRVTECPAVLQRR